MSIPPSRCWDPVCFTGPVHVTSLNSRVRQTCCIWRSPHPSASDNLWSSLSVWRTESSKVSLWTSSSVGLRLVPCAVFFIGSMSFKRREVWGGELWRLSNCLVGGTEMVPCITLTRKLLGSYPTRRNAVRGSEKILTRAESESVLEKAASAGPWASQRSCRVPGPAGGSVSAGKGWTRGREHLGLSSSLHSPLEG